MKNLCKYLVLSLFLLTALPAQAGKFVDDDGLALSGYDLVSYFQPGGPLVGSATHEVVWNETRFHFSTPENAALFSQNPEKYMPQYNGYCAFGLAVGNVSPIDPMAYSIADDRLFLMINQATLAMWQKNEPKLIKRADKFWQGLTPKPQN